MKKMVSILFIIMGVISVVASGMAKSDYIISGEEISQIETGGTAFSVTISNNYAYVYDITDNDGGLFIIEISDPTNPIKKSRFFDGGSPYEVVVRDEIAYVADRSDGLEILNVSNPSNPVKIGSYKITDMYTTSVKIFGDYAFIGDLNNGLIKLNITNLSDPVKINSIPFSCPSIGISENFLVTINHNYGGLEIRDLENLSKLGEYAPSNADLIHSIILKNLFFTTNHYSDETGEVHIVNISDSNNPTLLSTYKGTYVAQKCFGDDNLLYVPCGPAGIDIVDISNPAHPKKVGSYSDNSGTAFNLYVNDNISFVADGIDGLEIIRMTFKENSKDVDGFSIISCILAVPFIQRIKKYKRNK